MKLHEMRPEQCKKAIEENWPLFLPLGTIEYHGEHLPLGVDTTVIVKVLESVERKINCVIAPALYFGLSSYAVSGPEKGTIDINPDYFEKYLTEIFRGLIENGYRNILAVIHHQYEGENLMPMALAAKKAALGVTFKYLEEKLGRGWWGANRMKDYYKKLQSNENPFNWIRVIPLMNAEIQKEYGYDHAGRVETSLMLYINTQSVNLKNLKYDNLWFTEDAQNATANYGKKIFDRIVKYLIKEPKPQ